MPVYEPAPILVAPAASRPVVTVDAPHHDGRGLLIGAGVTGAAGLMIKAWITVTAVRSLNDGGFEAFLGGPTAIMAGSLFYNPPIAASLGMLAGGMYKRGKTDAYWDTIDASASREHMKPRPGLGWGLFGGGMGLWLTTRLFALRCSTPECVVGVWEGGYYASLAMTAPGIAIGAYSTSYENHRARYRRLKNLSVAPIAGPGNWGLTISGKF